MFAKLKKGTRIRVDKTIYKVDKTRYECLFNPLKVRLGQEMESRKARKGHLKWTESRNGNGKGGRKRGKRGKRLKMGRGVNIFLSAFAFGCKKLYLCISKGSTRVFPFFRFRPAGGLIRPKRAFERAVPDLQKRLFELLTTAL